MTSVGIDVSKGKSTVSIISSTELEKYKTFEILHEENDLNYLSRLLKSFEGEVKVVMEATGVYHLPILQYLLKNEIFVAVINPLEMKKYSHRNIRKVKTDKKDSLMIANYGIDYWNRLKCFEINKDVYFELNMLERQYRHMINQRVLALQGMIHMLDYTMPGLTKYLISTAIGKKNKLADFAYKYWHFDNITKMTVAEFAKDFTEWEKEKGYRQSELKAQELYELASKSIPTLESSMPSLQMMVQESIRIVQEIDSTLNKILAQMDKIARELPEYSVVKEMKGMGDKMAVQIIAEIGDVRRFHNSKALIAYAGIDAPPYQSGQYISQNRHITKRGSSSLRKVGYELMMVLKMHPNVFKGDPVYEFIVKKECEGKPKRVAKIAGLNKFLRIYYAKVKEVYDNLEKVA